MTHELVLDADPADRRDAILAFVGEGLRTREHVIAYLDDGLAAAVDAALPSVPGLELRSQSSRAQLPGAALRELRAVVAGGGEGAAGGRGALRIVDQRTRRLAAVWPDWRRYEAALDRLLDRTPVAMLCVYDEDDLAPTMVDDVRATHPVCRHGAARLDNPAYRGIDESSQPVAPPDRLTRQHPEQLLRQPTPAQARAAVDQVALDVALDHEAREGLVLATSEIVTNAILHGRHPVEVAVWAGARRVVVTVSDAGPGPDVPFAGLGPAPRPTGGLGLWIAHQRAEVTYQRHARGFTVTLASHSRP